MAQRSFIQLPQMFQLQLLNLDQLLQMAAMYNIPVSTRIIPFIIRGDIERAFFQRYHIDPQFKTIYRDTPLEFSSLPMDEYEIGVSYRNKDDFVPFLQRYDFPLDYVEIPEWRLRTIISQVIRERRLPVPREFWFTHIPSNIYILDSGNAIELLGLYSDENIQEYIPRSTEYLYPIYFLSDADFGYIYSQIKPLARWLPLTINRKTILNLLRTLEPHNSQLKPWIEQICRARFENAYPDRAGLIGEYQQRFPGFSNPFRRKTETEHSQLIYAPYRVEEAYLHSILSGSNPKQDLSVAFETPFESIADYEYIDVDQRVTRAELLSIVRENRKAWLTLTSKAITDAIGFVPGFSPEKRRLRDLILRLDNPGFELVRTTTGCSNLENTLGDELNTSQNVVIYGTIENYRCYTLDELDLAFIVEQGRAEFRRPEAPQQSFTPREVESLQDTLEQSAIRSRAKDDLIRKIVRGTRLLITVDQYRNRVPTEYRDPLIQLFTDLFQAGMYQRRWPGPGNEYPLELRDTRGGSLDEIQTRMTPLLNNILDIYEKLPPLGQQLLREFPTISYSEGYPVQRTGKVWEFIEQTRRGEYCIGFGSGVMIYTGFFYLQVLGVDLPGFDIRRFNPQSTHRD